MMSNTVSDQIVFNFFSTFVAADLMPEIAFKYQVFINWLILMKLISQSHSKGTIGVHISTIQQIKILQDHEHRFSKPLMTSY